MENKHTTFRAYEEEELQIRELINLVRDTRLAQKKYFQTRAKEDLIAAKELEKKLDEGLGI